MSESKIEIFVGAIVVAIAIYFTSYLFQVTGVATETNHYVIHASFRSAEGVRVGTDVRLAGVKIGTVTRLELDSASYEARSTLSIEQDILIPDDSSLSIASEGLLGGNFVEVVPGGSFVYLEAGDEVVDTQGSISLIQLMMRFVSGTNK